MKKVLLAAVTVLLIGAIFFVAFAADLLYGDANGDGYVNGKDLIRLRKYLNGEDVVLGPEKCEEHTYGEWYVTLEPTCTKAGIIKRKCAACGELEEDTTPALGHKFGEDGVCIRCGEAEPIDPTPDEYFIFTLLDDGTYEIRARDVNDMPAKIAIPATHDELPVSRIGEHGFENCARIICIFFSYNVSGIGGFAFSGCSDLRRLVIPDGVAVIGEAAFAHCYALKSISVPDSVTDIGVGAFSDCTVLESITVSESNPSYYGTDNCLVEKESNILIAGCKRSVIPAGVTGICSAAFYGCADLRDIEIPDGVTFIGDSAFSECVGLTEITLPDSVTDIGDFAFSGCVGLTSVTTGSGLTGIGQYAFSCCVGLTSITIPDSVARIGVHAFEGCSGLKSVTIGNGVTNIGDGAFFSCFGLTSITIPDGVTGIGGRAFAYCRGLTSITIGNGITAIGAYALSDCENLTDIYYNGTEAQWNNVEKGKGWDEDTGDYTVHFAAPEPEPTPDEYFTFTLQDDGTYEIKAKDITNMPAEVVIPSMHEGKPVTSMGNGAFEGCRGITSITIPDSVTSIGAQAFLSCSGLETITVASGNAGYYSQNNCLIEKNGKVLILGCKTSVIPDDVAGIGDFAFFECSGLTSITIPDSVTGIGIRSFYCCTGLTSVTIGNGVKSIALRAFAECTGLTSVTIGSGIKSIGNRAFYCCSSLTDIYYNGTEEQWNGIDKYDGWDYDSGDYTVHCTDGDITKN